MGLCMISQKFRGVGERLGNYFTPIAQLPEMKKVKSVRCGGVLTEAKKIYTKTGNEPMVFATLSDLSGSVEAVVFPRAYRDRTELWEPDKILCITGRPQEKDGEMKLLVETAFEITPGNIEEIVRMSAQAGQDDQDVRTIRVNDQAPQQDPDRPVPSVRPTSPLPITLSIRMHPSDDMIRLIREACDRHPGEHPVHLRVENPTSHLGKSSAPAIIQSPCRIAWNEQSVSDLEMLLGPGTVRTDL